MARLRTSIPADCVLDDRSDIPSGFQRKDLTGQQFGKLIATQRVIHKGRTSYLCRCECGGVTGPVKQSHLTSGHTASCKCIQQTAVKATGDANLTHGHARRIGGKSRTYRIWRGMHVRCYWPKARGYKYYGGVGVTVCNRWSSFALFLADMGECPANLTLERVNPWGNYEPTNCKWVTWSEQRRNQRRQDCN